MEKNTKLLTSTAVGLTWQKMLAKSPKKNPKNEEILKRFSEKKVQNKKVQKN